MKCREHGKFDLCDHFEPFPQGTPSLLVLFRGWLVNKKQRTKNIFHAEEFQGRFSAGEGDCFFFASIAGRL